MNSIVKLNKLKPNKLRQADKAGTDEKYLCKLILTGGDSSKVFVKTYEDANFRKYHGVFPFPRKFPNVSKLSKQQIVKNKVICKLIKTLGLDYKNEYVDTNSLSSLRYRHLVLMTDPDPDGSHVKGLIINFILSKWPNLLKHNFIEQFIIPIVKVSMESEESKSFYNIEEYRQWQKNTPNSDKWLQKHYNELSTFTTDEAKDYFGDMDSHLIKFKALDNDDIEKIEMAFSKDKVEERREWLTPYMEKTKEERDSELPTDYLYKEGIHEISFHDFINKEFLLYGIADCERCIPCMVDGLKPSQRKVLYTCFKIDLVNKVNVLKVADSVAELTGYHHGETSLESTIMHLTRNFVGSDSINLLVSMSQFGTCLASDKDNAAPINILTKLNEITRMIFRLEDDAILNYLEDRNQQIEPEWYAPIIPMVLVNGCKGIGTGWSTEIPNVNPIDIIDNVRRVINGQEQKKSEDNGVNKYLFDHTGKLTKYESAEHIIRCFCELRLDLYRKRKEYLVKKLKAEEVKIENQIRFINDIAMKICNDGMHGLNMDVLFHQGNYASDPENHSPVQDFDYLMKTSILDMTELEMKQTETSKQIEVISGITPEDMWKEDLENLERILRKTGQYKHENRETASVSQSVQAASVSQSVQAASVSQSVQAASVSQSGREVSVSQSVQAASISQSGREASISQSGREASVS